MKTRAYILLLIINLLVVISYAQKIDSTNIDSLLQVKFDAYYTKTFSLEDSVFEEGSVWVEDIIFYDGRLHPKGKEQLDLLLSFFKEQKFKIEIIVHTDVRGKEAFNNAISKRRSEGVMWYFISKGISENRLSSIGKGESELIISKEETLKLSSKILQEKAHALNRRTEFKIISLE